MATKSIAPKVKVIASNVIKNVIITRLVIVTSNVIITRNVIITSNVIIASLVGTNTGI